MSNWLAVARDRLCPTPACDVPKTAKGAIPGTANTAEISERHAANDEPKRAATAAEIVELRELIAEILANDTEADRAETLEVASRDPDAALISFRALRDELRENWKCPNFDTGTRARAREEAP